MEVRLQVALAAEPPFQPSSQILKEMYEIFLSLAHLRGKQAAHDIMKPGLFYLRTLRSSVSLPSDRNVV